MKELFINAALITFIISFVIDYSGFITSVKKGIWRLLNGKLPYKHFDIPLFGCSLCLSFHSVWIYLILNDVSLIHSLAIGGAFAFSSALVTKLLEAIFNIINNLLNKF